MSVCRVVCTVRPPVGRSGGFTLLELLVVLVIAAIASVGVSVALPDATQTRLEREAQRLSALLEAARAQSQVSGVAVRWRAQAEGYVWEGLAGAGAQPAGRWLDADTRAQVQSGVCGAAAAPCLLLGPDALLAPQTVLLYAASAPQQRVRLSSDGVRPFAVQNAPDSGADRP